MDVRSTPMLGVLKDVVEELAGLERLFEPASSEVTWRRVTLPGSPLFRPPKFAK